MHPLRSAVLAALLLPAVALAVPSTLSHQGRLVDATGVPLEGPHEVTFTLYDAPSSGEEVWTGTRTLEVDNGFYALTLGDDPANPIDPSALPDDGLFLGIRVGDDPELAPRLRLTSVPYALRADTAVGVDGGPVDATEIRVNGELVVGSDARIPWSRVDGPELTLSDLSCGDGQLAVFDGGWTCGAAPVHEHDASDITAGTLDVDRLPVGTSDRHVAAGDHTHAVAALTGTTLASLGCASDEIARYDGADWQCAPEGDHVHGADAIVDGTLAFARLPVGTGAEQVARGDHTHALADLTGDTLPGDLTVGGLLTPGTGTCDATTEGALSWNDGDKRLEICADGDWQQVWPPHLPGAHPTTAAASCQAIRSADEVADDGLYWLDGGSGPYRAYCDMTTDGGGWTLVATISDTGDDVWSALDAPQDAGLWDSTATLGDAPTFDADYKSRAWSEVPSTSLLVKQTVSGGSQPVLQADTCWSLQPFRAFVSGLSWDGGASDGDWSDASGAHLCDFEHFGYTDPVLRAGAQSVRTVAFKWGERDGVQDTNKDRVMITTHNANGRTHHVDSPTGLGGFTRLQGDLQGEDANECTGDYPEACTLGAQTYTLWVR